MAISKTTLYIRKNLQLSNNMINPGQRGDFAVIRSRVRKPVCRKVPDKCRRNLIPSPCRGTPAEADFFRMRLRKLQVSSPVRSMVKRRKCVVNGKLDKLGRMGKIMQEKSARSVLSSWTKANNPV